MINCYLLKIKAYGLVRQAANMVKKLWPRRRNGYHLKLEKVGCTAPGKDANRNPDILNGRGGKLLRGTFGLLFAPEK